MKKILGCILTLLIFFCIAATNNSVPDRPDNVHPNAKWDNLFKMWDYKFNEGGFIIWQSDGTIKSKRFISKNKKYFIEEDYHKNGKLKQRGQEYNDPKLREEHAGEKVEWIAVGKWKEYHENGNLKREWCYSPKLEGLYWMPKICGEEIFYDESGKEIKRLKHKLKCKYGCDEVLE